MFSRPGLVSFDKEEDKFLKEECSPLLNAHILLVSASLIETI